MKSLPLSIFPVLLLAACHPDPTPISFPTEPSPNLSHITWLNSRIHQSAQLTLNPDHTFLLQSTSDDHQLTTTTGRWKPTLTFSTLLDLGNDTFVRVYQRNNPTPSFHFDTVASRTHLLPQDNRYEWVPISGNSFVYVANLATYSDESLDAFSLLGLFYSEASAARTWSPQYLEQQIRPLLPPGWSTTSFQQFLLIAKDDLLPVGSSVNAPAGGDDELLRLKMYAQERYVIIIHGNSLVSPSQRQLLQQMNTRTTQKLAALQPQLKSIPHKFDSYLPRTDAEKSLVENYENLKSQFIPLPTHHDARFSYSISTTLSPYDTILSPAPDITPTTQKILSLFSPD